MRRGGIVLSAVAALGASGLMALTGGAGQAAAAPGVSGGGHSSYHVYWDQNEEEDFLSMPSGHTGQLVPPYDPNGQMCIFPDGSGRFVTGYNPTLASQDNPGSLKPVMQPPVGEAVWSRHGDFTGKTIYVPGPYMLPGQTVGGDIPPDTGGTFNNNGTFTGCTFNREGDLFATDLGTAQGQFPTPDNGRLIEWFAPSYTTYCILDGPTSGGVGPHHVDGTGGLSQPGMLALAENGDIMVTDGGAEQNGLPGGQVLRVDHGSLPHSAAACGSDGLYPSGRLHTSVFFQGSLSLLPFPEGIAHDPACDCWAIASTFGDPSIAFFDGRGNLLSSPGSVPGETISQIGVDPNGYNPFGIGFAPDGTAYFADIHIQCSAPLTNCGPENNAGRIMKVSFVKGVPQPATPIDTGINFPTSVTVCHPGDDVTCPTPAGRSGGSG